MSTEQRSERRLSWVKWLILIVAASIGSPVASQTTCSDCHDVDETTVADSVHGFLECADCHAASAEFPHGDDPGRVDCSVCHDDATSVYASSIHGRLHDEGIEEAPACASCHGGAHRMVPVADPLSPVNPVSLAATCGSCHADPVMVEKFGIPVSRPLEAFSASTHARALARGDDAPSCNDCHGSHGVLPASDSESLVHHQRVPDTCGRCHKEVAAAFVRSVHGKAAAHGAREAPVCTDCHGEHRILSPSEPGSPVYATNVPKLTCGRCHADLRLGDKYGFEVANVGAYADSYHGLASRAGEKTVASCASCHGVHDILPSNDPESHVHEANLPQTCGACHPGAGQRFAIGPVHVLPKTTDAHPAIFWVRRVYLLTIWSVVLAMLLHNALDLRRKFKSPPVHRHPIDRPRERMLPGFRVAHGMLMVSFVVLVYTGFALTYPEAWWVVGSSIRGWVHRIAAVVMLAAFAWHLIHLALNRRARACIAQMLPRTSDWVEFRERLAWYFGSRPTPPPAPRLGYAEKMEYLALMWGTLIMAVSGVYLWFDDFALRWFPKWVTDLATVVHFYEAVLASLAILVWHLYFVIFDPVVYPMDTAWLTGRSAPGREAERTHDA